MRRAITALAAAALLAGCSGAGPTTVVTGSASRASSPGSSVSPSGSSGPASLTWGTCASVPGSAFLATAQCASLAVPLDHDAPGGRTITLALSRVRHTVPDSDYLGAILVNPGGPGGSGLWTTSIGGSFGATGQAYDWIGFDPRGIGASRPRLTCTPTYMDGPRPPYLPADAEVERTWKTRAADYATSCRQHSGELIDHVRTTDTARDMDSIRVALGLDRISYYGFSYGTYLGQVYATLFPTHVQRMVLDSNVDARTAWYQSNLDQNKAIDRNMRLFFGWVARHDSTYGLGTTEAAVQALYESGRVALDIHPQGKVGGSEWTDTFVYAAYSSQTWKPLAQALVAWSRTRDTTIVGQFYESNNPPGDDNAYAGYVAVQCTDAAWPTSWATWQKDNTAVDAVAPLYTWANAWFNLPCLTWPAPAGPPVRVDGSAAPPTLLIDETLDAPTPYAGSLATRALFPHSSLLAEPGGVTHAESADSTPCVVATVTAYLATGALPPRVPGAGHADKTCPAPPLP